MMFISLNHPVEQYLKIDHLNLNYCYSTFLAGNHRRFRVRQSDFQSFSSDVAGFFLAFALVLFVSRMT